MSDDDMYALEASAPFGVRKPKTNPIGLHGA